MTVKFVDLSNLAPPIEGKPLGRNVKHDPASLAYPHVGVEGRVHVSVRHNRHLGILDQGPLGSCTGNAAVGDVGTDPVFGGLQPADGPLNEPLAVNIYSDATAIDGYQGTYPPDDTGSDGLSVAKVLKTRGWISGYTHAFTLADALDALQDGPVMTGVAWHADMDNPHPADGLIDITGPVRGGHEFDVDEFVKAGDPTSTGKVFAYDLVGFPNSWGTGWGLSGRAYMRTTDWGTLLADNGDVTVLVPNGAAPPPRHDAPFPGATAAATARILRLAAAHSMTPSGYLNWRFQ